MLWTAEKKLKTGLYSARKRRRKERLCLGVLRRALTITAVGLFGRSVSVQGRVIIRGAWNFTSELLEGLASGLRDEERGEDTAKHEESKNLHDVIDPWVAGCAHTVFLGTPGLEWPKHDLCDNGTDLA